MVDYVPTFFRRPRLGCGLRFDCVLSLTHRGLKLSSGLLGLDHGLQFGCLLRLGHKLRLARGLRFNSSELLRSNCGVRFDVVPPAAICNDPILIRGVDLGVGNGPSRGIGASCSGSSGGGGCLGGGLWWDLERPITGFHDHLPHPILYEGFGWVSIVVIYRSRGLPVVVNVDSGCNGVVIPQIF